MFCFMSIIFFWGYFSQIWFPIVSYVLCLFFFFVCFQSQCESTDEDHTAWPHLPTFSWPTNISPSSPPIVAVCRGSVRCNNSSSHFRTSESRYRSLSAVTVPEMSQLLRPPLHAGTPANDIAQCWWTEVNANVKVLQHVLFATLF